MARRLLPALPSLDAPTLLEVAVGFQMLGFYPGPEFVAVGGKARGAAAAGLSAVTACMSFHAI